MFLTLLIMSFNVFGQSGEIYDPDAVARQRAVDKAHYEKEALLWSRINKLRDLKEFKSPERIVSYKSHAENKICDTTAYGRADGVSSKCAAIITVKLDDGSEVDLSVRSSSYFPGSGNSFATFLADVVTFGGAGLAITVGQMPIARASAESELFSNIESIIKGNSARAHKGTVPATDTAFQDPQPNPAKQSGIE